jgi:hypothetical protein
MKPEGSSLQTTMGASSAQNFLVLTGFGTMFATNLQNIVPGRTYLLTYYVGGRPDRVPSRTATTTVVMPVAIENVASIRTNFYLTSANVASPASVATQTLNFCGTSVTPETTTNNAVFFSKATKFWGSADGTTLVGGWTKVTFEFTATPRTGSNTNSFYLRFGPFPFLSTNTTLNQAGVGVCIGGLSIARIT